MSFIKDNARRHELLQKTIAATKKLQQNAPDRFFNGCLLAFIAYRLYSEIYLSLLEEEEYKAQKFRRAIQGTHLAINYATLKDEDVPKEYADYMREKLGLFIMPSALFTTATFRLKRGLNAFSGYGHRLSFEGLVAQFFESLALSQKKEDDVFRRYFKNPEAFGQTPKDRFVKLTDFLLFVNAMSSDLIEEMLDALV